ncbi:hypothetical protein [Seohaeicola zhoushanensis]|nr:hypothetical protein [Seohaeicola zhoushanensis]
MTRMTGHRRRGRLLFPALVVLAGLFIAAGARAEGIRGLFCNTHAEIDAAVELMAAGRSPESAAALMNVDAMRCTYVDAIRYVLAQTVVAGGSGGHTIYRARLTGVEVGGRLVNVSPPAELFFITPDVAQLAALGRDA